MLPTIINSTASQNKKSQHGSGGRKTGNTADLFFLSILYQKFISKSINKGSYTRLEQLMLTAIFMLSTTKILKKPFFFIFFHMLEKLCTNFTLFSKRRGRRLYFIPAPIHFHKRYKKAFFFCKSFFSKKHSSTSVPTFSQEKPGARTVFFFLSYIFKNKNPVTVGVHEFKKKIKKNRIFAHWRWR